MHQLHESVAEQIWVVAVVEPEGNLVKVGRKVPNAEMVIGADDRTLEKRPHALDRVRVNISPNPFVVKVIDRLMAGVGVAYALCRPNSPFALLRASR